MPLISPTVKEYLHIILTQRDWSWTVAAALYLVIGLMIRGLFLKPMRHHAKTLPSKYYHKLKSAYLSRSIVGWIFFLIPLVAVIMLWNRGEMLALSRREWLYVLGSVASFILSIIFHIAALGMGAIDLLKKITESSSSE